MRALFTVDSGIIDPDVVLQTANADADYYQRNPREVEPSLLPTPLPPRLGVEIPPYRMAGACLPGYPEGESDKPWRGWMSCYGNLFICRPCDGSTTQVYVAGARHGIPWRRCLPVGMDIQVEELFASLDTAWRAGDVSMHYLDSWRADRPPWERGLPPIRDYVAMARCNRS